MHMHKKIGILGGMGPEVTLSIFHKLIEKNKVSRDQDHIPILIDNNSIIPDRTAYLLGNGESPLKQLVRSAIKLELMGANIIIMVCNTAHYFYEEINQFLDIPFLNMVEVTAQYIKTNHEKDTKVGLLATKGTYFAGVYEKYFRKYDIEIIRPSDEEKDVLMEIIYEIKKGNKENHKEKIYKILKGFDNAEITTIILGCTELPLLFDIIKKDKDIIDLHQNYIDTTDILATVALNYAKQSI